MSLPQRSPASPLSRQAAHGQRHYSRPTAPAPRPPATPAPAGVRSQRGVGTMGQPTMALRPVTPRPGIARPAPRAAVSFLTVTEVASIMRVSKMTVYRLLHGGELAAVRVGRSFRVPEPAVRDYLADARTDVA